MIGSWDNLTVTRRGPALWVTLDNPPMNTPTFGMREGFSQIFRQIARDDETRCVVLTGAGDTFSAGGDIHKMSRMLEDHGEWVASMPEARQLVLDMLDCDKPIIGRINGNALGLGATVALCCDVTVMLDTARIGDTHVKMGLVAGDGGALLWPHLVGLVQARRYLLTGELLDGRQAHTAGLVTEAATAETLDEAVERWVTKLGHGATQAIAGTKRALNAQLRQQAAVFMDAHLGLETQSHLSEDHREAVTAFLEKRKPVFSGR